MKRRTSQAGRVRTPLAQIPLHQRMAVGSVAGVLGTCAIFPADTIKTRMQAGAARASLVHTVRSLVAREGSRSLYRGLLPALCGTGPEKAVKLAVNDGVRDTLKRRQAGAALSGRQQVAAGAAAGVAQALVSTPNELVKVRMQLRAAGGASPSAWHVVRELGPRGLFRGLGATLARDLPYNVVFFPVYGTVKSVLCRDGRETGPRMVASGATAGMMAAWLGTPMDLVKTRLQAQGSPYTGVVDCVRSVAREEGLRAFFTGAASRVAVQAPLYAIVMAAFELQKAFLASRQASTGDARLHALTSQSQSLKVACSTARDGRKGAATKQRDRAPTSAPVLDRRPHGQLYMARM